MVLIRRLNNWLHSLAITWQLLFSVVLATMPVAGFGIWDLYREKEIRYFYEIDEFKKMTELLARAVADSIWDVSLSAIRKTAEAVTHDDRVVEINIFDDKNVSVFHSFEAGRASSSEYNYSRLITRDDKTIGEVQIRFSFARVDGRISDFVKKGIFLLFFEVLILASVIILFVRARIVVPLLRLKKQAALLSRLELQKEFVWTNDGELPQFGQDLEATRKQLQRFILSLEDQTRVLEAKVVERTDQLLQSSRMAALGQMAAGMAHEINNPLTVVLGEATLICMLAKKFDTPEFKKIITRCEKIMATVDHIANIIKGLRAFARDGVGDPFQVGRLDEVIQLAVELCSKQLLQSSVELTTVNIIRNCKVMCRPGQLVQVLVNLISNAKDAILDSHSPVKKIQIELREFDAKYQVRVIDSGPGVPKNLRSKLMEPFFTTKEPGKGTGLGLSISSGIIEVHGGRLLLDETQQETCFLIELPRLNPIAESEENNSDLAGRQV